MTQPSATVAKLTDKNDNPQIGDRLSAIASITDNTNGTPSDIINDTVSSGAQQDDMAALAAKINEILAAMRLHGLMAD